MMISKISVLVNIIDFTKVTLKQKKLSRSGISLTFMQNSGQGERFIKAINVVARTIV